MRFLNRAGKSREPGVAYAMPLLHVTGAGMGNLLHQQRLRTTKPACKVQISRPSVYGLFPVATFLPPAAEVI